MAELREDKKRAILDFLEENAEKSDSLVALEVDQVVEQFSNESFDEDTIEDIIDELEEDDLIEKKTAKLNVVYPSGYKDTIESRFEHLFESSSVFASYFVGTLVSLFLFDDTGPIFQYVFGDAIDEPSTLVINGILFGVIGVYLIGRGIIEGYKFAQKNLRFLQEQRQLLVPILLIGVIVGSATLAFTTYTSRTLTTSHFIQIISITVIGGVAISKYLSDGR